MSTRSLQEYRAMLAEQEGGTIPVSMALRIVDTAVAEVQRAHGAHTLTRAMELSGRSRSWFKRRLARWRETGQARQLENGTWLIRDDAIPRGTSGAGGLDLSKSDDELLREFLRAG